LAVKPVQADPAFVARALHKLARVIVPDSDRVEGVQRLSGGASQQTWAFEIRGGAVNLPLVLRHAASGGAERVKMTAGLEVEAHLIAAAKAAGVPVPDVRHVLRPEDGLGEGFVMERLQGETLGRRIVRDARFANARRVLARQCGAALARIHAMPTADLPNTLRRGGPGAELRFQIDLHRSHHTTRPVFELAFQWLRKHCPNDVTPALVHGDFRNGNLMVGEGGLLGVLDWELAHLGDPMEDLGWLCVNAWRFGSIDLPVGGFGTLEDLFEGYAAAGGQVNAQRVHYWEVMGTLKWGIVCESMLHAWLAGHERDVEKAAIGRRASESEIDLLALLAPR
jgi:aminoglycoside phosphotransferase (APT) family kinase protein